MASAARDWKAYNTAQCQERPRFQSLLADLVQAIPEPDHDGPGRPPLPLSDQAYCTLLKVYTGKSMRRAQSLYEDAADRGHMSRAPHFNTPSKFLNRDDANEILHGLLGLTTQPLTGIEMGFAVDATGFQTTTAGAYNRERHRNGSPNWLKLHACTGTKTNIVTAAVVSDGHAHESPYFTDLIEATRDRGFDIQEVSADKAYSSRENHDVVDNAGGEALIPFKSNATGSTRGSPAWRDAYHYFELHREEFEDRYHQRSNVESTFGALKGKFGEKLFSRNWDARKNELLTRVVAYNICVVAREAARLTESSNPTS